ncbi:Peptidoglycan glycosyltransferase [Thalassoporum mexicanum PCC 7367]|nr:Peptidoglycan glycosyltransferase [Pseudanabaena sp. PCC 7367]
MRRSIRKKAPHADGKNAKNHNRQPSSSSTESSANRSDRIDRIDRLDRSNKSNKSAGSRRLEKAAPDPNKITMRRLVYVWLILCCAALGLVARLAYLQVIATAELTDRAKRQQVYTLRPFIPRRSITDRNGTVLAVDKPVYTLFAHPQVYKEKPETIAAKLAPILEQPPEDLLKLLDRDTTSVRIEYWLTEATADRIHALQIDGLDLIQQRSRIYPQKELVAGILGYVNVDHEGQAGVERSQEKLLRRDDLTSDVTRDGYGKLIPTGVPAGMMRSDRTSLQLTIDARIQRVARQSLKRSMEAFSAKRGAVLVMDAQTGGMVALVSEPSYDPNRYYETDIELFKNWAVSDLYEPGSTFKPINVAIALETGAIMPDTVVEDQGSLIIGGWPVSNYDFEDRGYVGPLSISQVLQNSSNVGMVHIVQRMQPSVYYGWLERIGLGDISGVDLPSETPSTLKPQEQFINYTIEPATAAFGQGLSLTPIQMIQMHGILASGGKLLTPHVVKALINEEGEEYYQPKLNPHRQVFSAATANKVVEMMTDVVELGTGRSVKIPGYRFGGKTGTAQKADPNGGYADAKITSFVAIFPAENPKYVLMAVVDEPIGADAFGSTVAAPIIKDVIEDIIVAEGIPPSHPEEVIAPIMPAILEDEDEDEAIETDLEAQPDPALYSDEPEFE